MSHSPSASASLYQTILEVCRQINTLWLFSEAGRFASSGAEKEAFLQGSAQAYEWLGESLKSLEPQVDQPGKLRDALSKVIACYAALTGENLGYPLHQWITWLGMSGGELLEAARFLSPLLCAILDGPKGPSGNTLPLASPGNNQPEQYVTLTQAAAIVNKSKRTLYSRNRRQKNPLPNPDIEGGGGKQHEWKWSRLRPYLEEEFGRELPERFPDWNFPRPN